jgi:pimeloyl-ACP methyl ester carboxylesterase
MIYLLLTSCGMNLDFMLHNGIHCSIVDEDTCEKDYWDKVCRSCEEDYEWDRSYEWMEGTLKEGESVRGISPDSVESHRLPTTDGEGELDVYLIPAHGDNDAYSDTLLVFNHGNYAGIEHYMPRIQFLHEAGFAVLAWDYRGYGKSEPETVPNQDQFMADARQVIEYAGSIATDPDKVIIYANSLGGIPGMEQAVATDEDDADDITACATILEVAFLSVHHMTESVSGLHMPGGFMSTGQFENHKKMERYGGPLLMMYGTLDHYFLIEHAREVFDIASGPKEFWELEGVKHGIGGGGVPKAGLQEYFDKIDAFLVEKAPGCLSE